MAYGENQDLPGAVPEGNNETEMTNGTDLKNKLITKRFVILYCFYFHPESNNYKLRLCFNKNIN